MTTWADQSGNGYNLTDIGSGKGPTITAAFQNGIQSLTFLHSAAQYLQGANIVLSASQTWFVVAKCTDASWPYFAEHSASVGGGDGSYCYWAGANAMAIARQNGGTQNASRTATAFGTAIQYVMFRYDSAVPGIILRRNGSVDTSGAFSGTTTGNINSGSKPFYLGARAATQLNMTADVLEVIGVQGAVSSANYLAWEAYTQARYALP